MRAVRIAFNFSERVVLSMHRNPLARAQAGGYPQTESEHERDNWMKLERFVGCCAMKKNGGAEDGDLRDESRREQAPGKLPQHASAYHIS